jgi:PIN domain nuclease of toxin-antitoxin system
MINLLLDTHAFFWWCTGREQLSENAQNAIMDGDNIVYVSAAVRWEMRMKESKGQWPEVQALLSSYNAMLAAYKFIDLPITSDHADASYKWRRDHGDPFDRIFMAQAELEDLRLVTRDQKITGFLGPRVLW